MDKFEAKVLNIGGYHHQFRIICQLLIIIFSKRHPKLFSGIVWTMAEPCIHIGVIAFIFDRFKGSLTDGYPISVYICTALIPFLLIKNIVKNGCSCLKGNKSLFTYKRVTPLHILAASILLDVLTYTYVGGFIFMGISLIYNIDLLNQAYNIVIVLVLVVVIFSPISLILMCIREKLPNIQRVVNITFKPLYFTTAPFFAISMIPDDLIFLFQYNPIYSVVELNRHFVINEPVSLSSPAFILSLILFLNVLSSSLYITFKTELFRK